MYIDEGRENEPAADYIKKYDLIFNSPNEINSVLMIGGAGYSYPRYYITKYLDKQMDVVEIDPKVTELAKKYFYLDTVLNDDSIKANDRLKLITDDGRIYLNKTKKKYDAILNDAFTGNTPPKSLTTLEAAQRIKEALNVGGVYATNIISALEGEDTRFLKAEVNTLRQVFDYVYVYPCGQDENIFFDPLIRRNNLVFASDQKIEFEDLYDLSINQDEIVLTDDYCPVDTLVDYGDF